MNPRSPKFIIRSAGFPTDLEAVRKLFRDYQADIAVDLCFQNFAEELATLPGRYQWIGIAEQDGEIAGCAALRPFSEETVELKRLFVYPAARGAGLGKLLTLRAIEEAHRLRYSRMHLDTIQKKMPNAVELYRALGFVEVAAAGGKGPPGLVDMELDLLAYAARDRQP